jgi:hypothetical protein
MIYAIGRPSCERPISYERPDLYTPQKSLRRESAPSAKEQVLLVLADDGHTLPTLPQAPEPESR